MTNIFISEIHYDNTGTDANEGIEITGPANTNLAGWSLVLYNGNNRNFYNTRILSGIIPNQQNNFGSLFFSYPTNGIQNGPDAIALVDNNNNVIQFLSYEGIFTAANGPAIGLTSIDISVIQNAAPLGQSLQLTGTGTTSANFSWTSATNSYGTINTGQTFPLPILPGITITETADSTNVNEENQTTDTYNISLNAAPTGQVEITISADSQTQISTDGVNFLNSISLNFPTTNPQTITVRAINDSTVENSPHTGILTHSITNSADPAYSNILTPIPNLQVNITDNETPNTPPTVNIPISDIAIVAGTAFSFKLPENIFVDADGEPLTYSVTLSDGTLLPSWLNFDALTLTFGGTSPENIQETLRFLVTAKDSAGASVSNSFNLLLNSPTPSPTPAPTETSTPTPAPTDTSTSTPTSEVFADPDVSCLCDIFPTPSSFITNPTQNSLNGSLSDDFITGTDNRESINSSLGNDTIIGKSDNDNLVGEDDNDLIFSNTGNDYIDGGKGRDTVFAGKDNDVILGSEGDDILLGEIGNDTIIGGTENDLIIGNTGHDIIDSGKGEYLIFAGKDDDIVKGYAGNDTILGNFNNDTICGGKGNDILFGNSDFHILDGCEGDDTLQCGKDNDILIGGKDNDILDGDFGSDTLSGGLGNDNFILEKAAEMDIITDLKKGEDLIILSAGLTFQELIITADINSNIISTGSELLATLNGVQPSLIDVSDFQII
ncbi:putative Ig domain-containing protein [Ancylothrix sp. C2]|uniref:putative Ig domain-containing protein n=1 Tax=Ancylothrix sp. D3o TaxID=2953691 RepID=UPI0021BA666B|nr:putative Ig domain-containing protein [Ancylothrix sp. D3o]MCT7949470.1 putative Ig domain-containing protein [Ancylothrix sp. D3o]